MKNKTWLHHLIIALTLTTAVATLFVSASAANKLEALLLLLATAGSITALARELPLQSVLFAAFITALCAITACGLSGHTGLPFGPVIFGKALGPQLFHTVPWTVGLIWIIAIFNSRGVAKLILRPWRKARNYGFVLIGLTTALALMFDLALEPFVLVKQFWFWQPTKIPITWYCATPATFLGWIFVTLIVLAIITPFLIRKQPGNPTAPDFTPLVLWLGSLGLFAAVSAQADYWPAVILDAAMAIVVTLFSWRGARW